MRTLLTKFVLLFGTILLTLYLIYRVQLINLSPILGILAVILFIAELHTIFHLYGLFYSLWPRPYPEYKENHIDPSLKFNLFICVCGEPEDVVEATINGAKEAVEYYNQIVHPGKSPRIYVLNDGRVAKKDNWKGIQSLAKRLGVNCITRTVPGGFKAGNLNNAIAKTSTKDAFNTLDVVFDSDFAAKKEFLVEIVKPFKDKSVDFVQSPQRYRGEQTWVAQAAAAHQIFFFDYICPAKSYDNALFLCGTNFAIRRSALLEAGGIDTNFITEDYATSIKLHLLGKKGVFMPKVLALGIAPTSLKQYFSQQRRWSKGSFDTNIVFFKKLFLGKLSLKQKFHYLLSATYYLIGLRDLILMLAPLPYLFWGVSLIKANPWQFILLVYAPLLMYNFILYTSLFTQPLKSIVLDIVSFPVFTAAFLSAVTKKELGFIVTIKKYEKENPFSVYRVQLLVLLILLAGLYFHFHFFSHKNFGGTINIFWASFDATMLALGFYLVSRENYSFKPIEDRILGGLAYLRPIFPVRVIYLVLIIGLGLILFSSYNENIVASIQIPNQMTAFQKPEELLVPSSGTYYGYYRPEYNSHPQDFQLGLTPQDHPSLVMYYQDWTPDTTFDTDFNQSIYQKGAVPVITWEPWQSSDPKLSYTNYTPEKIIAGDYDLYIKEYARQVAAYHNPVFIRFAHEMNGNWYPWGDVNGNSAQDFILMWRHVHDIFVTEGATNALWVWSPNNTDQLGSPDSLLSYYPGDNYVDWVGFSGFNWGSSVRKNGRWMSFKYLSYPVYSQLITLNKPIMISETSSSSIGGNKQSWFDQTLNFDIPSYPQVKAVIFYDDNFKGADFSLRSGMNEESVINQDIVNNGYYLKRPLLYN